MLCMNALILINICEKAEIKGQHQCQCFRKSVFFGLKFSLNLEYEAKGFIHKKNFSVEFRVFPEACRASLIYSTRNFKRVFLETRFFQNGTHHNSNNFQYFLFKFQPHISNNIFKRNTYGFFDKLI